MSSEYINNKNFEKLIIEYLKNRDDKELLNEVTMCFYLLAENIIRAFKFKLIERDDALQEGVTVCLVKIDRFDPERGKAFNWFTTIILNHYRQLYRSAKNYIELKSKFLERQTIGETTEISEVTSSEPFEHLADRIRRNSRKY